MARYFGVGAATLVPALVIAQQRTPPGEVFRTGDLVTATKLEQMRVALIDAIARIDALERNSGSPLTKDRVYVPAAANTLLAPGAIGQAVARCEDQDDIAMDCTCTGSGGNSTSLDLRVVSASNDPATSECKCFAQNVATTNSTLVAFASCIRLP